MTEFAAIPHGVFLMRENDIRHFEYVGINYGIDREFE